MAKEGITKAVRNRAAEVLDDERLVDWKGEKKTEEDGGEDEDEEVDDEELSEAEEGDDEFGGFDD